VFKDSASDTRSKTASKGCSKKIKKARIIEVPVAGQVSILKIQEDV
jgi:hypothetical protein